MLLEYKGVNPLEIDYRRAFPSAFTALKAGNVVLLGSETSPYKPELYSGNIAELLLQSPSTAVMHFSEPAEGDDARGIMMAVNYHDGHSEGHHKIVVQDPSHPENGQWELWVPPGSGNRTFFKRANLFSGEPHEFESMPTNPSKIANFYMHTGSPDEAINDFLAAGFTFNEELLTYGFDESSMYLKLDRLSRRNEHRWDPFAEQ